MPANTDGLDRRQAAAAAGCLPTLWQQDERFSESYLAEFPGYYKTADAGFKDDDGYVYVMGRTDDIINVAGHRLSTGGMEEVLAAHQDVAECAVIGVADELKGEVPCGFIVLKAGVNRPAAEIEQECVALVREKIGPVAAFKLAITVGAAAEDALGQDPARHHEEDRRRRALDHAGDDRRSGDPRRDRRRAEGQGRRRVNDLRIRTMRPDEIAIAVDWAAAEGWNPGLADAACFATVDPDGFLIGELDGAPAATVSCVNYDARFAFLGFYIVREDLRGRGYGLRIWNAAIAHAGARVIGLDGVVAQQENYKKSGFALAYANVRYGGTVAAPAAPPASVIPLTEVPLAAVEADDATVFPAPRAAFLRAWIGSPGHVGRALVRDGRLAAWGVIRPCRTGLQDRPAGRRRPRRRRGGAGSVAGGRGRRRDLPRRSERQPRRGRAGARPGLAPVFETARMYTGAIPPLRLERVFGVTTFELG